MVPVLVGPDWLAERIDRAGIRVIDNGRDPASFMRAHLPGSLPVPAHPYLKHFDPRGERTQHVLAPSDFRAVLGNLGWRADTHYIVYDDHHGLTAARFWWVARHYGLTNVSVLDGGFYGWLEQGHPVTAHLTPTEATDPPPPAVQPELMITAAELQRIHARPEIRLWDTRRPEEFSGQDPNGNQRCGHVPGARHLPWTDLLTGTDEPGVARFLRPAGELRSRLAERDLRPAHTIIPYCQSGIRAAFGALVLAHLGYPSWRLYDASMGEWSNRPDTPLAVPEPPRHA